MINGELTLHKCLCARGEMIHDGPQALDLSIVVLYQIILTAAETCSQRVRQLSKHNKGVEVAMGPEWSEIM